MGPIKPALVVCTACLIGIFQVKRRRKELPAPNGEPAVAASANRESVEAIGEGTQFRTDVSLV